MNEIVMEIMATPESPRNTEGSFVTLKDGSLLFAWWHFTGGVGDDSEGCVGMTRSYDEGRTWSEKTEILVPNWAEQTIGSVSLLRLASGKIALLYLVKHGFHDCRPYIQLSEDEGATWSKPILIIDPVGYFVVNNDRLIQLSNGRLVVPAAFHRTAASDHISWRAFDGRGIMMWYLSNDEGLTWREAQTWWAHPTNGQLQEPGVIELKDGRLFCYCRTTMGCQYGMYSEDAGETWSAPEPTSFISPCSPLSIKRIPKTGDLLAIWNDHSGQFPVPDQNAFTDRTPLVTAISTDENKTWTRRKMLEDSFDESYCYTAIHFLKDTCLIAYALGSRDPVTKVSQSHLSNVRMRRVSIDWLYEVSP
jgi:sialidase-1